MRLLHWFRLLTPVLLLYSVPAEAFTSPRCTPDTVTQTSKPHPAKPTAAADSSQVRYFFPDFEKSSSPQLFINDTTLETFRFYDPIQYQHRFYATLGNIGQFYRNLLPFSTRDEPTGFQYGIRSFDHHLFHFDSIKYYRIYKTYSQLSYVQGGKKEQHFNVEFSRDIYKGLNLGFNFRVLSSPGAYLRQKTNHINLNVNAQYFTLNKRYGVVANFIANRLINFDNGGIKYDSLFTKNIEPNRLVIPVNLLSAETRISDRGFYMKHYFDLTGSEKPDTGSVSEHRRWPDLGRVTYAFNYYRQSQSFTDSPFDSSFFPPPLIDSLKTHDSLVIRRISNIVTWSNPPQHRDSRPRILQFEGGIRHVYSETEMQGLKYVFLQYTPFASVTFTPFPSMQLSGHGEYVLGDYNERDFLLKASHMTILGSKEKNLGIARVSISIRSDQPGWFYSHYRGNFFRWDRNLNKTNTLRTGFSYQFRFLETGVEVNRVTAYVYLDTASQPRQLNDEFAYMNLFLKTDLKFWRFRLISHVVWQTVQKTNVLRIPAFMGSASLLFTQPLFRGAALLQPGIDALYTTSYYANAYNPSIRSFYLQEQIETGNYPYLDIFINLKIQRARFFVTYTHFNAGLSGRTYFTTPSYPMRDGAFKFGISWRFHD